MDLKSSLYSIAGRLGVFHLARLLSARGVRVFCYHGVVPDGDDLADFHPKLFMRQTTLRRRLETLARRGYNVMSLDQAAERIGSPRDLRRTVVLTFDDGWHGTFEYGLPILAQRSLPSTVYIASADCITGRPVYNVAVQYLLWKFPHQALDLSQTESQRLSETRLRFSAASRGGARDILLTLGTKLSEEQRFSLLRSLAAQLGPDAERVLASRRLTFATLDELRASRGPLVSLQLHTHHHHASLDSEPDFAAEIMANRRTLESVGAASLHHFCYPSGRYAPQHAPWLAALGVDTATTTVPGRWTANTNRHFIPRFVDSDGFTDSLFEAELSGLQEALRVARSLLVSATGRE
jgi:peptidoglycan/xylan/chitin deacetylase (PgdA/CDA1 family)